MNKQKYYFAALALISSLFIGCAEHDDDHGHDHPDGHAHAEDAESHAHDTDWQPEFADFDDDQGHGHDHTPHDGIIVPFRTGQSQAGFLELKLHDDKGDLELWLTKDKAGATPFDLPLDSMVAVLFPQLGGKTVELQVRNDQQNEDEDGKGNIRNKKTNYFIFPGDTKADASFLVGKDFVAEVVISFASEGITHTTAPFKLSPHSH
ncbi:hypothetical protein PDESU_04461 [Pontiella desulfatans]|uniref:Uncharacterized protein n=1 Tax=Pontiella desulfatans TaxID=2750659 RepID=A0A6C2U907_PONDE|nr:hypothetical protein [Pontiella desulfatans]VGO15874.1 hypothetical protein PDESU_04461 [Pontiella desulfatans]